MPPRLVGSFFVVLLTMATAMAGGDDWRPIDLSDPTLKKPVVETDADAEAIFWDVQLDDSSKDLIFSHYVRIKVFTERGRALESKIDITYSGNFRVESIAGRTIKPDGSIIELKKEDIFDRTIVKFSGVKVKAKSFALPGVEPGAIVEYRWHEVRPGRAAHYVRLPFQREIPVRTMTYRFKPSSQIIGEMRQALFHMPPTKLVKDENGFYSATMTDVSAFREEPHMPPQDEVRPWMLVYYSRGGKEFEKDRFWQNLGKEVSDRFKANMKVSDEVRRTAAEAIGNASSPEEKLQRLFDYCRSKIKNVQSVTAEERSNRKENKSPAETLKRGIGDGLEIDLLFAALVTATGSNARVALSADRSDIFFNPSFPDSYFLSVISIAVKLGEEWRFFDPGSTYVPYGMLRWQEEGEDTLVADPGNPIFVSTPVSPAEKSKQLRRAKLRLTEDGTLEGDVRVEYSGHLAVERKERNENDSAVQREQTLRDELKRQMSTAELSDIHFENVTDPDKPFVSSYHVRVPGYAERTGKRIFLQPAFLQHGVGVLFPANDRHYDIYFNYSWSEEDEVAVELPEGYAPEGLDDIQPSNMGMSSQYKAAVSIRKDGRAIEYRRSFSFGETTFFPISQYEKLKDYFELLHRQDSYTITLKQQAAPAN